LTVGTTGRNGARPRDWPIAEDDGLLPAEQARRRAKAENGPGARAPIRLGLMRGFTLELDQEPLSIPLSAQRVVAFVALRNRPTLRPYVAEMLWLDASQDRAMANLRSALWRLRQPGASIVEANGEYLSLSRTVAVDVVDFVGWAHRLLAGETSVGTGRIDGMSDAGDLLPDWYDDWVLIERERLRQLRLHVLERACVELTAAGDFAQAIELGLAAIADEPLHESGHAALINAHLCEGNRAEALRQFDAYARLMREELHLQPAPQVLALVAGLRD
jgi:DNA-binding SARP family transcriptional activator